MPVDGLLAHVTDATWHEGAHDVTVATKATEKPGQADQFTLLPIAGPSRCVEHSEFEPSTLSCPDVDRCVQALPGAKAALSCEGEGFIEVDKVVYGERAADYERDAAAVRRSLEVATRAAGAISDVQVASHLELVRLGGERRLASAWRQRLVGASFVGDEALAQRIAERRAQAGRQRELERALRFDPHSDVRRQAAYHIAVWQTDAPALTELLVAARAAETDPDVVESLDGFIHHDADEKAAAIEAGEGPPGMTMAP